jgi:hypothetical protein
MEMKYVVVNSAECGEQLFVFPKNIDHDKFAEVVSNIRHGGHSNWKRVYRKPVSAGFTDGKNCYGLSETLNLKSRLDDTALLNAGGFKREPLPL